MACVLIVDDEVEIVELLKIYLNNNGFEVLGSYNAETALRMLKENQIDIVILDIMMPVTDGFQLLKTIRGNFEMPVMFLSAKDEDMDKIYGLGLGADDYMTKPFNPLEVVARIQALLRRYKKVNSDIQSDADKEHVMEFGELCINPDLCQVCKNGKTIELTSVEYKLLTFFAANPEHVFTKRQLYENVWGQEYICDENIIMVYISRLREKIEYDSKNPKYIKTIRGLGYRFERTV